MQKHEETQTSKPTAIGGMSRIQLDTELFKGVESLKTGKTYTDDEVGEEFPTFRDSRNHSKTREDRS